MIRTYLPSGCSEYNRLLWISNADITTLPRSSIISRLPKIPLPNSVTVLYAVSNAPPITLNGFNERFLASNHELNCLPLLLAQSLASVNHPPILLPNLRTLSIRSFNLGSKDSSVTTTVACSLISSWISSKRLSVLFLTSWSITISSRVSTPLTFTVSLLIVV